MSEKKDNRLAIIFANEFNRLSDEKGSLSAFKGKNRKWAESYFQKALICSFEVDSMQKEIELILSKVSHQNHGFLIKTLPLEELVLMLKLYLLSWSTMKDLMAKFISETLDLGIADLDLSFGAILRNKKVLKTNIPDICSRYQKLLDISNTDKKRNEIAHRGKLLDEEVESLRNMKGSIESSRYSLLVREDERISEDEYNLRVKEYYSQLKELVNRKQKQYQEHFDNTIRLNTELVKELAQIYRNNLSEYRT